MRLMIAPLITTNSRVSFGITDDAVDVAVVEVVVDEDGILVRVRLDDDAYKVRTDVGMS